MGYILHVLCVTLLSLASCPRLVAASNVLGFGAAGGRSHQFAILRVGQELQTRGHNFTMLVSSQEGLDLGKLGSRSFEGLKVVHFAGPKGIGTAEWFANLPRDVAQVRAPTGYAFFVLEHMYSLISVRSYCRPCTNSRQTR